LPADIFQINVEGEDDNFAHLHVVIINIDAQQRLFVPAYDATKEKVTDLCDALHKRGIYEGIGWIELDNAKEVKFDDPKKWTGKLARWVPYKLRRIERRNLSKRIGEISDAGLGKVVECLLKLHAEKPASTLADDELPKVKKLATQLGVKIPPGI
jgi:hypothetical protein